jgi:hypothetical protein
VTEQTGIAAAQLVLQLVLIHAEVLRLRGERGPMGIMGVRGERGEAAPAIRSWQVDRTHYTATPIMSDGSREPPLELHGLFEQFLLETQG